MAIRAIVLYNELHIGGQYNRDTLQYALAGWEKVRQSIVSVSSSWFDRAIKDDDNEMRHEDNNLM